MCFFAGFFQIGFHISHLGRSPHRLYKLSFFSIRQRTAPIVDAAQSGEASTSLLKINGFPIFLKNAIFLIQLDAGIQDDGPRIPRLCLKSRDKAPPRIKYR